MNTDEALRQALKPPEYYFGAITELVSQGWAQVGGKHRDSDILDISNYESMLEHYRENYELNDDYRVEGSSHWAVGWCDTLLVRALDCDCEDWEDADIYKQGNRWLCNTCGASAEVRPIFEDAMNFRKQLEDYPVLDEEDYLRREYEDTIEYLEQEVGEDEAADCFSWLFDNYSVSRSDDIEYKWIQEWKEEHESV